MATTLFQYIKDLLTKSLTTRPTAPEARAQREEQRNGPGFALVAFVYSPVSSKEELPIYDRCPLGLLVGTQSNYIYFCNIHWLMEQPKLLLAFERYRQNALVSNSKTMKDRALQQILAIAKSSPQPVLRKYRAGRIAHWHVLTQEEETEMFRHFPAQFRRNENEHHIT